jgi:anti-anti-sigma factor
MSNNPFSAQLRKQPGFVVIDLHGEINAEADDQLNAAYDQAAAENPHTVVLNFSQVSYINSTGIALIVGLLAQARKNHSRLVVYGLSDHYNEIFTITRLSDFMTIYMDEADVLEDMRAAPTQS